MRPSFNTLVVACVLLPVAGCGESPSAPSTATPSPYADSSAYLATEEAHAVMARLEDDLRGTTYTTLLQPFRNRVADTTAPITNGGSAKQLAADLQRFEKRLQEQLRPDVETRLRAFEDELASLIAAGVVGPPLQPAQQNFETALAHFYERNYAQALAHLEQATSAVTNLKRAKP